jgi:hypothetical protein
VPATELGPGRRGAVVAHGDLQRVRAVRQGDARGCTAGVLDDVGQRLLDDPVGRQLDARRQVAHLAVDAELGRQAVRAHLANQLGQVVQGRLRQQVRARVLAQHRHHPAHLVERAAADPLDRAEHLAGVVLPVGQHPPLGAGLHHHRRHVVTDHVVQLAGDPLALADDGLAGGHLALPLGQLQSAVAAADRDPDEDHCERGAEAEVRARRIRVAPQVRAGVGQHHERHREVELAIRRPHRHPVDGAEPAHGQGTRRKVDVVGARGQQHLGRHADRHRVAAAQRDAGADDAADQAGQHPVRTDAGQRRDLDLVPEDEDRSEQQVDPRGGQAAKHASTVVPRSTPCHQPIG